MMIIVFQNRNFGHAGTQSGDWVPEANIVCSHDLGIFKSNKN